MYATSHGEKSGFFFYLYDFKDLVQRDRHSSLCSLSLKYSKMSCPKYYFLSFYLIFGRLPFGKNAQFVLEVFLVLFTVYTTSHGRSSCLDLICIAVTLKTSYGGISTSLSCPLSTEYSVMSAPKHVTILKHDLSPNLTELG